MISLTILILFSCKVQSGSDQLMSDLEKESYKLTLSHEDNSRYYFDLVNETQIQMEVEGKELENLNRSTIGMRYAIDQDSTGDMKLQVTFDKIQLYTKNQDKESYFDTDNTGTSLDPVQKMVEVLKSATIISTYSLAGERKSTVVFEEIGHKIMADFAPDDTYGRQMAQSQWDKMMKNGFIGNHMDQLFNMFPDSAVRIGEKWKLNTKEEGEFDMNLKTTYRLKSITGGVALIESESEMESDPGANPTPGFQPSAELKGEQKGRYEMDAKTGMLISSKVTSNLDGTMQVMGREIPVTIEMTQNMKGRRIH